MEILNGNIVCCPVCGKYLRYDDSDIKKEKDSYLLYGCEENSEIIYTITCPVCYESIKI